MGHRNGTVEVRYVNGYASLAAFLASDRDESTAIYRRFDRLSARNLLYLQSELVELEALQDKYDAEDRELATEDKTISRNWAALERKANEAGSREEQRMRLILKIRAKLKEYRKALMFESTLISLQSPHTRTLEACRKVFNNEANPEDSFPALGGSSAKIFDDPNDLVALRYSPEEDRLTRLLRHFLPLLFTTQLTEGRLAYISERRLRVAVAIINVVLAASLLFGAILNLYFVTQNGRRLGFIAGYTTLFAIWSGLLTNARRVEVFAACAAYAAVLVVFVSGNLANK